MPTLKQYRQCAAQLIGPFLESTATSGSTTSQIEDTAWPVYSSISQNDLFTDQYILRPGAAVAGPDRVRVVATYSPGSGFLAPDKPWSAAPYALGVGETYELHGVIEPWTAMTQLVNQALKRCYVVAEVTLTPVADAQRHRLDATYAWLTEPKWVRQVGVLSPTDNRAQLDPYRWRPIPFSAEKIGAAVYLNHPGRTFAPADDTLYLKVLAPGYDYCRPTAGVFGAQSGLALDTDEAVPQAEWVAWGTLVEAWLRLGHVLENQTNNRMLRDHATASQVFTAYTNRFLDVPEYGMTTIESWGPPISGGPRLLSTGP